MFGNWHKISELIQKEAEQGCFCCVFVPRFQHPHSTFSQVLALTSESNQDIDVTS